MKTAWDRAEEWGEERFPICKTWQHVLKGGLARYVRDKLEPLRHWEPLSQTCEVHVVGVHGSHFEEYLKARGWKIVQSLPDQRTEQREATQIMLADDSAVAKVWNVERPSWHLVWDNMTLDSKVLVLQCTPGRDFMKHMAQLLRFQMGSKLPKVLFYPDKAQNLFLETGLAEVVDGRARGAIVFLGYVQFLHSFYVMVPDVEVVGEQTLNGGGRRNFGCNVLKVHNRTLVFLGVRFPFWGDMAGLLAEALYNLGAETILYVAKLGALTTDKDISNALFVPNGFHIMTANGRAGAQIKTGNCLNNQSRGLQMGDLFIENSGKHISVPSIMDETSKRIEAWNENYDFFSIDNEASYFAFVAAKHKKAFGMAHYATDVASDYGEGEHGTNMLNFDPRKARRVLKLACELSLKFVIEGEGDSDSSGREEEEEDYEEEEEDDDEEEEDRAGAKRNKVATDL